MTYALLILYLTFQVSFSKKKSSFQIVATADSNIFKNSNINMNFFKKKNP